MTIWSFKPIKFTFKIDNYLTSQISTDMLLVKKLQMKLHFLYFFLISFVSSVYPVLVERGYGPRVKSQE